jgi:hypothetical protein
MTSDRDPAADTDTPACAVCLARAISPAREALFVIRLQYSGPNASVTSPRMPVCRIHHDELVKLDGVTTATFGCPD